MTLCRKKLGARSLVRVGRRLTTWAAIAAVALAAACGTSASGEANHTLDRAQLDLSSSSTTTAAPPVETTTTTAPTTTTTAPPPPVTEAPTTTRPHPPRSLTQQPWVPYATVGPVVLHHPTDRVEAIGYHQSGHDGAQQQSPVVGSARWFVQETRDRGTGDRTAADIVVEPDREVRAPVTGRVIRAGTYTLYCDHTDQYAVIEPDTRPGWEVKVLHVEGLALSKGQRVEAGVTRLAARARVLPFSSTVEDDTAVPAWPHIHLEVVDPSIPDRPSGPGCP